MTTPHRGLRHVAFRCRDIVAMERFYVDVLGYKVEWRPDADNVYLTQGADSLALHAEPTALAADARDTRLDHIGVLLEKPGDVELWADRVSAAGGRIAQAPKTHRDGCRSFYAFDPDGNRIQFLFHPKLAR